MRIWALVRLVNLVLFEISALWALQWAGTIDRWRVRWDDFGGWVDRTPPIDVACGLGRWVALVVCVWLAASTFLYLLAAVTRFRLLSSLAGALTLPVVRDMVMRATGVGLLLTVSVGRTAALAHDMPAGGWTHDRPPAAPATVDVPWLAPAVAPTELAPGTWTVAPGDSMWTVAGATIGEQLGVDPESVRLADMAEYWQRVCELNEPPSGDDDLLFPGNVLTLPPIAAPAAAAQPPGAGAVPLPTVVAPAEPVVSPPTTTASPAPTAAVSVPPVPVAADPLPTIAAPSASTTAAGPEETVSSLDEAPADSADGVETNDVGGSGWGQIIGGGGLFAAGVLAWLRRRRSAVAATIEPGETEVPLDDEDVQTETEIRAAADADVADLTTLALRAAAGLTYASTPLGAVVTRHQVQIVMHPPLPALPPFEERGSRWSLSSAASLDLLDELAGDRPFPVPAMVPLGRTTEGGEVLVNLELPGLVSIEGAGSVDVVRAVGLALATSPWPECANVVLVGFEDPPLLPHVIARPALTDDFLEEIEEQAAAIATTLAETELGSTAEARARDLADSTWIPTVIVCLSPPTPALARRLAGLVSEEAAGVCTLIAGPVADVPSGWALSIRGGSLAVPGLGEVVSVPQQAGTAQATSVKHMLERAIEPPVPMPAPETGPGFGSGELVLRVLGPPTVEGCGRFERSGSVAALAYLVLHRGQEVSGADAAKALWPLDAPNVAGRNLNTAMWHLRQVTGNGSDGEPHVRPLRGRQREYTLGELVTSDLDILRTALVMSSTSDPDQARELLADALAYVRGEPFAAERRAERERWKWAQARFAAEARDRVVDAAARLHRLAADADDLAQARFAVNAGLLAAPENETLLSLQAELDGQTITELERVS